MKPETRDYYLNTLPFINYPYTGEMVACPACGGSGTNILKKDRKRKPLQTDICEDCGLFFTNPMPTDAELGNYYKTAYRAAYMGASKEVPAKHIKTKKVDAARRAGIIKSLFDQVDRQKTLDFGCGLGELVLALDELGFEGHGFEPGDVWSKHAKSDRILQGDWQAIEYEDKSFDFVSIIHVLEHLRAPKDCLEKVHSLLKDDGMLWIEVPDMQAYKSKGPKRFHFAHVLGFSNDNLLNVAWQCGFYPIRKIEKSEINKKRSQVSFVFRKARSEDELSIDLQGTYEKNKREYG